MTMDREKEREAELENAMYTNCLLLGLDPSILNGGAGGGSPRVGQFRHSNPKMGEQLLYFLLCALRGPMQSAKDFDKVWPIFDSGQARDFRKIVQGIITELESEGALPRSNSRVSSLATCCGPRFVELLWQLSLHALREVHRRTFAADVASNPLPASLTEMSYSHAVALLPVLKARIALERRKFINNAHVAVQRQAAWSSLAQDMTIEFRSLCAEEAYLQQELEKIQDLRNKMKLDELLDDDDACSISQSPRLVSRATHLWDSLLKHKSQHELLASGPIEDLVAHREHRYRISGSALLAAMDQSSQVPDPDHLSDPNGERASTCSSDVEICSHKETESGLMDLIQHRESNDGFQRIDDRGGRVHRNVDIAEILRRWTHALQRIHKQSLHLVKANEGEGPELLRCKSDNDSGGHAESLAATLEEHRQHLSSIQTFINQLKEAAPTMEKTIAELTEEISSIFPTVPSDDNSGRLASSNQAHCNGRADRYSEVASQLSSLQFEEVSSSSLELPQLFNSTPSSSIKSSSVQKKQATISAPHEMVDLPDARSNDSPSLGGANNKYIQGFIDIDNSHVQRIRRSVREAAFAVPSNNSELSEECKDSSSAKHYFVPLPMGGVATNSNPKSRHRLFTSPENKTSDSVCNKQEIEEDLDVLNLMDQANKCVNLNVFHPSNLDCGASKLEVAFCEGEYSPNHVPSPPLLTDSSMFGDAYEDLLAPLSEIDAALMEC